MPTRDAAARDEALCCDDLRETWRLLSQRDRVEGFLLLPRAEAEELFFSLSAADQAKLANRCLWILKHPQRYKKRLVDTCWYVARRIPKLAQAVGQGPQR